MIKDIPSLPQKDQVFIEGIIQDFIFKRFETALIKIKDYENMSPDTKKILTTISIYFDLDEIFKFLTKGDNLDSFEDSNHTSLFELILKHEAIKIAQYCTDPSTDFKAEQSNACFSDLHLLGLIDDHNCE